MSRDASDGDDPATDAALPGVDLVAEELDVDEASMFLTRRQATVLAMRERGLDQGAIASELSCSRANVSNIERSARENIEKARATLSFAEVLTAPVRVELPAGLPLHEAPERIYAACDEVDLKVNHGAPELMRTLTASASDADQRGRLTEDLVVSVTSAGEVHVLTP